MRMPPAPLYLNPDLFFLIKEGSIFLWNFKDHEQFEIDTSCFQRLVDLSTKHPAPRPQDPTLDQLLIDQNIISGTPYPEKEWGWDALSYIFHKGTSDLLADEKETGDWLKDYLAFSSQPLDPRPGGSAPRAPIEVINPRAPIALPKPNINRVDNTLLHALYARKTCRQFLPHAISLEDLSTLLFLSFGYIHGPWKELKDAGLESDFKRKSSPSGGCLHLITPYVFSWSIDGLGKGVYRYIPETHALEKSKSLPSQDACKEMLGGQYFFEGAALGIFLCANFAKSWQKYPHSRAYRVALFDAGHVSQTFQLLSTSLGLNTWISAFFSDSPAQKMLNTDLAPLLFLAAGKSNGAALPKGI